MVLWWLWGWQYVKKPCKSAPSLQESAGRTSLPLLTVHIHSYGLDGRWAQAVLSLAVVAASLVALDVGYPQRFIEDARVLKSVRRTSRCFGPPDLSKHQKKKDRYLKLQVGDLTGGWRARSVAEMWGITPSPRWWHRAEMAAEELPVNRHLTGSTCCECKPFFLKSLSSKARKYFQNSYHQIWC